MQFDVVVEIPKGQRNKYEVDHESGRIRLDRMLFTSTRYPSDYGFIEHTLADDGDPLDLLVIAEAGTFLGCLVEVRLIGGIQARQTQRGKTARNDRLIGVAAESRAHARTQRLGDLPAKLLDEIERFFVTYNEARGRRFRVDRRVGPGTARRLVREGERRFAKKE